VAVLLLLHHILSAKGWRKRRMTLKIFGIKHEEPLALSFNPFVISGERDGP
jgi:hypothetical protein